MKVHYKNYVNLGDVALVLLGRTSQELSEKVVLGIKQDVLSLGKLQGECVFDVRLNSSWGYACSLLDGSEQDIIKKLVPNANEYRWRLDHWKGETLAGRAKETLVQARKELQNYLDRTYGAGYDPIVFA